MSTSTVILSNIPFNCQESDIHRALLMYGTAMDIQLNHQTSQAAVTMRNIQEAQALLSRHTVNVIGSTVRVDPFGQPQPPQQPTYPPSNYYNLPGAGGAPPPPPPQLQPSQPASIYPGAVSGGGQVPQGDGGSRFPTNRLRIVVEDCRYTVTRDVLLQMFSMIAPPTHVYCGPSGPTTIGNVEFSDVASAERAMQQFNNQNIYPGCCFVKLSYDQANYYHQSNQPNSGSRGGRGGAGGHPGFFDQRSAPRAVESMPYLMQQQPEMMMNRPPDGRRGGRGGGSRGGAGFSRGEGRAAPYYNTGMSGAGFDPLGVAVYGGGRPMVPQPEEATVVISNVAENVPLYDLWVLLEVYGNVDSLRRQYKDKTSVSAQFQHFLDAKTAVVYLQNCPFHDRMLGLKLFAGYVERGGKIEWNAGPATDPATQAVLFTSGFHHRTKPSAPFNPLSRIRPDKNLFVSNLVDSITDDELKSKLTKRNAVIEKFYRKNATVAIVGFKDIGDAINALVAAHGIQLKERYLRITFSRFPPEPLTGAENEQDNMDEEANANADSRRGEGGEHSNKESNNADNSSS
ncbi:unnamed protein product [Phytomonas sp. EM1]|nr:unnamed protein product [Phytomonas sp. EM1]|eukprot:CCW62752.1 unnamed protein product [Phytomonas sp. isolate EM1]